jgi:small-conductance mechanosensitive channel
MREFGSSSVDFTVSVWTDDPWNLRKYRSDLNEAIWWALKNEGITIAFPQVDVHFDRPVEEALQSLHPR